MKPVVSPAGVVNRSDGRVVQPRKGLHLPLEYLKRRPSGQRGGLHDLQGHVAGWFGLPCLVNDAHPTHAEHALNAILPNRLPNDPIRVRRLEEKCCARVTGWFKKVAVGIGILKQGTNLSCGRFVAY